MYKILHLPSGSFLKISEDNYSDLIKELKNKDLELINFNNFGPKIWSEEELTHNNTRLQSSYNNFIILRVETLIICEKLLDVFIVGAYDSAHLEPENLSLYTNKLFYTFVE